MASSATESPVIYQHPLAYLLGLEGLALLRAFAGGYDREFTLARFDEIRRLLASPDAFGTWVEAYPISTREGYDAWAASYDEQSNQLLELEQPIVHEILDGLPVGVALDAACGTGRHAAYLASLGHAAIGVDSSPGMLERARANVPRGEFHEGALHALPLPDDAVDVVVCAIALVHLEDIEGPFREFARVLRAGGHLVVSDQCGLIGNIGFPVVFEGPELDRPEGELGYIPVYLRSASEYLAAALPLGFRVLRCEEPRVPSPLLDEDGRTVHDGERLPPQDPDEPFSIWNLHAEAIDATNAAWHRKPSSIIWHFQLPHV
jgi:SAM-dependent methyltransferase